MPGFTIPNEPSADFADQAEPDSVDFEILAVGYGRRGVISGCAVTAQPTPDMTVAVAAGTVEVDGKRVAVTAQNVTLPAAHATLPVFHLISVGSDGVAGATSGSADSNPQFPSLPSGAVLAAVYVPAADTAIQSNQIVDKRVLLVAGRRLPPMGYYPGRIYGAAIAGGTSSMSVALNTLYAVPFLCEERRTFDRIGIRVAGTAAGNARLGIYNSGADGLPSSLLLDSGQLATSTINTDVTATISQELQAQTLYWLAAVFSSTPTVGADNVYEAAGLGAADFGASNRSTVLTRTFTFAALPNPFGTPTFATVQPVGVRLRAA